MVSDDGRVIDLIGKKIQPLEFNGTSGPSVRAPVDASLKLYHNHVANLLILSSWLCLFVSVHHVTAPLLEGAEIISGKVD